MAYTGEGGAPSAEGERMVRDLQGTCEAVDEKLAAARIRVFGGGAELAGDVSGVQLTNGHAGDDEDDDDANEGDYGISEGESESDDESGDDEDDGTLTHCVE